MQNIKKTYPGTVALGGANLDIHRGEIIGLLGENGAGKSTMMKVLVGYETPDSGEIMIDGQARNFQNTRDAMTYNVGMVYQDQALLPNLTVMQNLFLGYEHMFTNKGFLNYKKMKETGLEILTMMKLTCSLFDEIEALPLSTRELIEIGRLLWLSEISGRPPVIVLDEPTTVLDANEVKQLFEIIQSIRDKAGIIFISHHLDEVLELVDRVVVFRDGQDVASLPATNLTVKELQEMMIGRELNQAYYLVEEQNDFTDQLVLEVNHLTKQGLYQNVSFTLNEGEIVSIVGLDGSGKQELGRSIIGAIQPDSGEIKIHGKKIIPKNPRMMINEGIGYVPKDRREEGAFQYMDIASNISIRTMDKVSKLSFVSRKKEIQDAKSWMDKLRIKASTHETLAGQLSGGNQQKVILAKWLASNIKVLILDHPTRGIDIGAKEEFYKLLRQFAKQGVAILMMCDSFEEDIGLSNRLLVMKDGKLVEQIDASKKNKPTVLDIIQAI